MSAGEERTSDTKKEGEFTTKAIKPYKIPESNSVKPKLNTADLAWYSGRNALAVVFQTAQESDKAFEQAMYRKSALLQQRRRTGGWWLAARADKGWSGCAVLGNGKAHLGELASPPPPAHCAAVPAHAIALVHSAA